MSDDLYRLFGGEHGGMSIVLFPPSGEDNPDDMAAAWLAGDMERYTVLLAEHERTRPRYRPPQIKPKRLRGGQRRLDWGRIHSMRAGGATITEIASELGCSISQAWRVLQRPQTNQTMSEQS